MWNLEFPNLNLIIHKLSTNKQIFMKIKIIEVNYLLGMTLLVILI